MRSLCWAICAGACLQLVAATGSNQAAAADGSASGAGSRLWCRAAAPLALPQQALGIALDPSYAAMFSVGNRFEWQVVRRDDDEETHRTERWVERCQVASVGVVGSQAQALWACKPTSKRGASQLRWAATAEGLAEPPSDGAFAAVATVAMPRPPRAGKGHHAEPGYEEIWRRQPAALKSPTGARMQGWAYERTWGNGAGASTQLWLVPGSGVVRWKASFGDSDIERTTVDRKLRDCGGPPVATPAR